MTHPYENFQFNEPHADRPWTAINMVTTIDGKTVSGTREQTVMDLGSAADHAALRALENAADAILVGAGTVRATPKMWFSSNAIRVILTQSGNLPWENRVFHDTPGRVIVWGNAQPPDGCQVEVWDLSRGLISNLERLRKEKNVRSALVEGGATVNGLFLRDDLIDELFWTIAPKIKLGSDPTYADGDPFPKGELPEFKLISSTTIENEVFLRYQRSRA